MNTQKPKNTRAGVKRNAAVPARRPSNAAKETHSQHTKYPSGRNAIKPMTLRSREATPRSTPSKQPSPQGSISQPIRKSSKLTTVLTMLRAPGGTTLANIMKATGWQQHSVRGFFAGVVRKKLRLTLTSEKTDGERVYRVTVGKPPKSKPNKNVPTPPAA